MRNGVSFLIQSLNKAIIERDRYGEAFYRADRENIHYQQLIILLVVTCLILGMINVVFGYYIASAKEGIPPLW